MPSKISGFIFAAETVHFVLDFYGFSKSIGPLASSIYWNLAALMTAAFYVAFMFFIIAIARIFGRDQISRGAGQKPGWNNIWKSKPTLHNGIMRPILLARARTNSFAIAEQCQKVGGEQALIILQTSGPIFRNLCGNRLSNK